MKIQVDTAEPQKVINLMKKLHDDVEEISLPVGDIACLEKGIVIERKEISDFIQSIRSGHLQKQLLQMKQFDHPYLLISGSLKAFAMKQLHYKGPRTWTVEHHMGAISGCAVRYGVTVLTVENDTQLCKLAYKIITKTDDGREITIKNTELLRNTITTDDMKLKLLTCFKGLGIKKSEKLLNKNKVISESIDSLITTVQQELEK